MLVFSSLLRFSYEITAFLAHLGSANLRHLISSVAMKKFNPEFSKLYWKNEIIYSYFQNTIGFCIYKMSVNLLDFLKSGCRCTILIIKEGLILDNLGCWFKTDSGDKMLRFEWQISFKLAAWLWTSCWNFSLPHVLLL